MDYFNPNKALLFAVILTVVGVFGFIAYNGVVGEEGQSTIVNDELLR